MGADESYLVGNPFPSAISTKKFIEDNSTITGTLYFWQHAGEEDTSTDTSVSVSTDWHYVAFIVNNENHSWDFYYDDH